VRLLCWMVHKHLDFREAELSAVAELHGVRQLLPPPPSPGQQREGKDDDAGATSPFLFADFPDEATAVRIASRVILMRGLLEVWGEGATYDECLASARAYPAARKEPYMDATFCIRVEAFGRHLSQSDALERLNRFESLGFRGRVRLKGAQVTYWVLEDYGHVCNGPPTPRRIYFCRQVSESGRRAVDTYDLKKRRYLGPTSMDAELALICANMAHARKVRARRRRLLLLLPSIASIPPCSW
jgi:tRNA (guanine10-N2)-methyltransferase